MVQKLSGPKNLAPKNVGVQKILGSKKKAQKKIGSKNILVQINVGLKKIMAPKKMGQNWASSSWYIPEMDKCHKDKSCLDKCPNTVGRSQEHTFKLLSKSGQ